jgi:hypothetical protein
MFRGVAAVAATLLCASCASLGSARGGEPTTVHFMSHHGKDVDVAVTCGEGRLEFLGRVPERGEERFEIPAETTHCVWGLRFVLMPEGHARGYVTDRIPLRQGANLNFYIEKYPAMSAWTMR